MFTLGGAIQTFTQGFPSMVFGRILAGFGVGFLSSVPGTFLSRAMDNLLMGRIG
jgi:predicted MFS family arabinose efflux permease